MKYLKSTIVIAVLSTIASVQAAEKYTLKLNHFLPATASPHRAIFEPWCEKIKAESSGRLECQIYPAMQLGGTPAKLADMVRNGVADIVWTAPSYSPGKFPRIEALEQPFLLPYGAEASNPIIWKFYQEYAAEDFRGLKVLAVHGDGGMGFHTSKTPIRSLSDIKGLKIRTSNRASSLLVEELGGAPVSMPPAQMTEALSKGVIDGVLYTWASVREVKVDEVTEFHSQPPAGSPALSSTILTLLMNEKKFASLPQDLQLVIERNSGSVLNDLISESWDSDIQSGISAMPPETMVSVSHEDYQVMIETARPVAQNWVKEVSGKGIDGEALLAGVKQIAEAH